MSTLRGTRPASGPLPNTGTLLLEAFRSFEDELIAGLRSNGYELRPKHGAVLANIDRTGSRLTELARSAGMGKAAMAELVDELEVKGYVERGTDPTDGRAKLVVPTQRGTQLIEVAARVIGGLEAGYASRLGKRRYTVLRACLLAITKDRGDPSERVQPRGLRAEVSRRSPR